MLFFSIYTSSYGPSKSDVCHSALILTNVSGSICLVLPLIIQRNFCLPILITDDCVGNIREDKGHVALGAWIFPFGIVKAEVNHFEQKGARVPHLSQSEWERDLDYDLQGLPSIFRIPSSPGLVPSPLFKCYQASFQRLICLLEDTVWFKVVMWLILKFLIAQPLNPFLHLG